MTDLVEHTAPTAPAVQAETHELDGDLSKMAADLAEISLKVGKVTAGDKAEIKKGFSYTYAGLPTVINAIKPILAELKVGLVQIPLATPKGAGCVTHVLGQGWRITCTMMFTMGQASPQAIGSMQTYARRYSILGLFALAPDEDDGNGGRAEEAYRKGRGQQAQRQDQQNGRGPAPADPSVIIGAFAKHGIPEAALVAQVAGTPIGKIDATQTRDLRTLLQRLNAKEAVEDVFGSAALEEILNAGALGERMRTIETKAAVHKDAQAGEMFGEDAKVADYD